MSLASREWEPLRVEPSDLAVVVPVWPVAYASLFVVALWLRFGALDVTPLAPDEAAHALEALAIWRGTADDGYASPPLLVNLVWLSFGLFTAGDGAARIPSVLAGWAVCLTPLLFRSRLGNLATLASCLLLAISPIGLLASRSVNPASLAVLATALAAGCALLALERDDGRWLVGSGIAVGLGLGSSSVFLGNLLALAAAVWLAGLVRLRSSLNVRYWMSRAVLAGLVGGLIVHTLLLTRPFGVQAAFVDSLSAWPSSIGPNSDTLFSVGMFGLHELALPVLAAAALPTALSTRFGRFLVTWALTSILMALASSSPSLTALATASFPLALLGGIGITRLSWLGRCRRPAVSLTAFAVLVPFVLLALAINVSANRGVTPSVLPLAVAVAGLIAIALATTAWLDGAELRAAMGLAMVLGLVVLQLSFVARLNYAGFERGGPFLLQSSSRPELRRVEERAGDWWRQEPMETIKVDASLRPYLEWTLRDGPPIEWISVAPRTPERAILGGDTGAQRPAGEWLRLVVAERYSSLPEPPRPLAFWRWMVQRSSSGSLVRAEPHAILVEP
jgi:4-amino-4-deoxy-L-arabinose transferase-like glycosyltransferase